MRSSIFIASLLFLFSCNGTKPASQPKEKARNELSAISDSTFVDWINYYKEDQGNFSVSKFQLKDSSQLDFTEGHIHGMFDKEFDPVYLNFLIFSPDQKKYLDIDSYHWVLDENNEPAFEIDQEVNLVDMETKQISRIDFYGSTAWIENAFWQNDSTVFLLGNTTDLIPFVRVVNINSQKSKHYKYSGRMNFNPGYSQLRLEKGL